MNELIKEKILDGIEDKYLSEAMDYAKIHKVKKQRLIVREHGGMFCNYHRTISFFVIYCGCCRKYGSIRCFICNIS